MSARREELKQKLDALHRTAFMTPETYDDSVRQKTAFDEYQILFAEFMSLPVNLGILTLIKVEKYRLPDGTETTIDEKHSSEYINGRAFRFKLDAEGKPVKVVGTIVDGSVHQEVLAEYDVQIISEPKEREPEAKHEVGKFTNPLSLPDIKPVYGGLKRMRLPTPDEFCRQRDEDKKLDDKSRYRALIDKYAKRKVK